MSAPEPASPLTGHMQPGRFGANSNTPVLLTERRVAVVQVTGRKGQTLALRAAVSRALSLDLPHAGESAGNGATTAIWIAPETWLILRDASRGDALTRELMAACSDASSIVDQSSGKSVLRLSGTRARDVLAKGCRIDLHPRVFAPGRSAVTPIAHIHAVLIQVDAAPTFDLIVPSTLARDFVEWLRLSAAEFGYELVA
ncbi:MAG: sarcosine oxidase subunit gamma [Hyphomicrobiaceae bacterium]